MILLHCIVQPESSGGESEVTDGLSVCDLLKEMDVDCYKTLSAVPVRWIDRGHDAGYNFHNVYVSPVIWLVPHAEAIIIIIHCCLRRGLWRNNSYTTIDYINIIAHCYIIMSIGVQMGILVLPG